MYINQKIITQSSRNLQHRNNYTTRRKSQQCKNSRERKVEKRNIMNNKIWMVHATVQNRIPYHVQNSKTITIQNSLQSKQYDMPRMEI